MAGSKNILNSNGAALMALALAACGAAEEQPTEQGPNGQFPAATEPMDSDPAESDLSETLVASVDRNVSLVSEPEEPENLVRAGEFYRLEWDDTAALCSIALDSLNKPYGFSSEIQKLPDGTELDYASKQALRFLGSNENFQWEWTGDAAAVSGYAEIGTFDYFNDGIERNIIRTRGQLASNRVVGLSIEENGKVAPLNFAYAGAVVEGLPDQDNLNTKLTYSVADVIRLGGNYYTILMPLSDFDKSERVYLATWRSKDGTSAPRAPSDYYAQLSCVFRSANASTFDLD